MQVLLKLKGAAVASLNLSRTVLPEPIRTQAEKLQLKFQRLHPNLSDIEMASYYVAESADSAKAQAAVQSLLRAPEVEAAYIKPPDEMP